MEVVPVVVDTLGAVSKRFDTWLDKLGITINTGLQQKTAKLETARILRKVSESWKRRTNPRDLLAFGYDSLPWCNIGTLHSPELKHFVNNNNNHVIFDREPARYSLHTFLFTL